MMNFDAPVPPGGYVWWYVDALSDDGRHGLTIIAFIGSVFSPYYAWARRRGPGKVADPLDHCTLNVVLYGQGAGRWAMTERGRSQVKRSATTLRIGPSGLRWAGDELRIDIDEWTFPLPSRLRGSVRVQPVHRFDEPYPLATEVDHRWCPIAPVARVEATFDQPDLRWSGDGYLDCNRGDGPLEQTFSRWHWSRAPLPGQRSAVLYDAERRGAAGLQEIGLLFDARAGRVESVDAPAATPLPSSRWGVPRVTRSQRGAPPRLLQTLTDAPFYARSLVGATWGGEAVTALHESLSLDRFAAPWVQAMLPFRMPRVAG